MSPISASDAGIPTPSPAPRAVDEDLDVELLVEFV